MLLGQVAGGLAQLWKETTIAHPIVVVYFSNIAATMVVEKNHHHIFGFQQMFQLSQALKGRATRIAQEQSFFQCELTGGERTISVGYFFKTINEFKLYVLG